MKTDITGWKTDVAVMKTDMTKVRSDVEQMVRSMADLTKNLRTMNIEAQNNRKRIFNSGCTTTEEPLQELLSLDTGVVIPGFPRNVTAISIMTMVQVRAMMLALGQPLPHHANLATARKLLRVEVGLSREPHLVPVRI
ncbi:hypothetical protein MMC31_000301 [Peltigera leucophlebia]|nr:hypothetical protein [Peltigera leucophlebia]